MNIFQNLMTGFAFFSVISCNNANKTNEESKKNPDQTISSVAGEFDIDKIPVSTAELGAFPYLSTPEGYEYSSGKNERTFEEKNFYYNDSLVTKVEGKYFHSIVNKAKTNTNEYQKTFVIKSYEEAIKKLGGVEIFDGNLSDKARNLITKEEPAYFKDLRADYSMNYRQYVVKTPHGNVWFELGTVANMNEVDLSVVQEQGFKQTITVLKADEIKDQLDKNGKAVLYINFDLDKSSLKTDGVTAVEEIAKLLENDKKIKLSIEGHTDNSGNAAHNQTLSASRATTVLKKLEELNIPTGRLSAKGFGADKPIMPNDTEENKAKNRRVELVKI